MFNTDFTWLWQNKNATIRPLKFAHNFCSPLWFIIKQNDGPKWLCAQIRVLLMNTSWYKEPWAWFVFILPATAVVAGIATYIIANHEPDALVVGDYYKKGKIINVELSKIKQAQKLGINFALKHADNELIIKPTGIEKIFPLLNINFYHPTLEDKDFSLVLTADGNGFFRKSFESDVDGKWKITITPFENHWKIQQTITLPQSDFIAITPQPKEAN